MSLGKRAGAEFLGTFWLVLAAAAAQFWRRRFQTLASDFSALPWHSD